MAKAQFDAAQEIGSAAGEIWHFLNDNGPATVSKIVKELDQPKDTILQGIGWLAREGKVDYELGKGKSRLLKLV